ncbi:hypothetical protein C8F01DRAFT_555987 [Mycena amicta]|nr:hypothetical protein C8F01DRAFT_555987 [Mycena amicta]
MERPKSVNICEGTESLCVNARLLSLNPRSATYISGNTSSSFPITPKLLACGLRAPLGSVFTPVRLPRPPEDRENVPRHRRPTHMGPPPVYSAFLTRTAVWRWPSWYTFEIPPTLSCSLVRSVPIPRHDTTLSFRWTWPYPALPASKARLKADAASPAFIGCLDGWHLRPPSSPPSTYPPRTSPSPSTHRRPVSRPLCLLVVLRYHRYPSAFADDDDSIYHDVELDGRAPSVTVRRQRAFSRSCCGPACVTERVANVIVVGYVAHQS